MLNGLTVLCLFGHPDFEPWIFHGFSTPPSGGKETKEERKQEVKAHIGKQKPRTFQPCNRCNGICSAACQAAIREVLNEN